MFSPRHVFFLITLFVCWLPSLTQAADVPVSNAAELISAIEEAQPGDVIMLAPGDYPITRNIRINSGGSDGSPITVTGQSLGQAQITFDALEGFVVNAPYWTFEKLVIEGICSDDSACEHAFHVVGAADNTIIRGNRVFNFNAHIKGNGNISDDSRPYPDNVLVEGNEFYSTAPRQTSNPVTPIDIVGGKNWIVRRNFIHDFEKAQGNNISYAAFLKGNSTNGVFERNLVVCSLMFDGGVRLGLSFGGGGTFQAACEDMDCSSEHRDGLMQNNIIANCSDVGIYLNRANNVRIYNNTLLNTSGIDARFETTTADMRNNLLDGRIRERNGGTATQMNNVENVDLSAVFPNAASLDFNTSDGAMFVDLGGPEANDDYCGKARSDGMNDIGALEYDGQVCDTSMPFATTMTGTPDAGPQDSGPPDAGDASPSSDASVPDAGISDTGGDMFIFDEGLSPDGGDTEDGEGCSCRSAKGGQTNMLWCLFALVFLRRRR